MTFPLIISTMNELVRVYPERIVYISSDGNYSVMVLHDTSEHLFSFNLSHFQQIIEKQMKTDASLFIRIGKGLIINREYIYPKSVIRPLNGSFFLKESSSGNLSKV